MVVFWSTFWAYVLLGRLNFVCYRRVGRTFRGPGKYGGCQAAAVCLDFYFHELVLGAFQSFKISR